MVIIPSILPTDYENDKYLSELYAFLKHNILPANDSVARQTLLLSEDFYIGDDNLLYRISVPRTQKQVRVQSTEIRLVLPQIYLSEVVKQCHDTLGHFSKERNFEFYVLDITLKICSIAFLNMQTLVTSVSDLNEIVIRKRTNWSAYQCHQDQDKLGHVTISF